MSEQPRTITLTLPDDVDRDRPQDAALAALEAHQRALRELIGYAERVEAAVRNSAMQDYLDAPGSPDPEVGHPSGASDPYAYAEESEELALIARSNGALALVEDLANRARELIADRSL